MGKKNSQSEISSVVSFKNFNPEKLVRRVIFNRKKGEIRKNFKKQIMKKLITHIVMILVAIIITTTNCFSQVTKDLGEISKKHSFVFQIDTSFNESGIQQITLSVRIHIASKMQLETSLEKGKIFLNSGEFYGTVFTGPVFSGNLRLGIYHRESFNLDEKGNLFRIDRIKMKVRSYPKPLKSFDSEIITYFDSNSLSYYELQEGFGRYFNQDWKQINKYIRKIKRKF